MDALGKGRVLGSRNNNNNSAQTYASAQNQLHTATGRSVEKRNNNKSTKPSPSHPPTTTTTAIGATIGAHRRKKVSGNDESTEWKHLARNNNIGNNQTAVAGRSNRFDRPTIASMMRNTATVIPKSSREKTSPLVKSEPMVVTAKGKSLKWDIPIERKRNVMPSTAATYSADGEKRDRSTTVAAKQAARERLWPQRKAGGGTGNSSKEKPESDDNKKPLEDENLDNIVLVDASGDKDKTVSVLLETGVQTIEAEILNHELLVGDVKLMLPSKGLVDEINAVRRHTKGKNLRSFSDFERQEEQHLDELREFSERNFVTKRVSKKPVVSYANYEKTHCSVFKSMDELFMREIPKVESIANIKERIKRKENELMSLFDNVDIVRES